MDQIIRYREEPNIFESIDRLPDAGETIDDVRTPRKKKDLKPLVNLRELVELLEERVLANAGVSAFDEVFKLIFAKLYDEFSTGVNETACSHSDGGMQARGAALAPVVKSGGSLGQCVFSVWICPALHSCVQVMPFVLIMTVGG